MDKSGRSHAGEVAPRFIDVLRVRPFAVLYAAETQSIVGDQLARVALSVLVYRWTHSPVATAATYAFTFLPAIVGGFTLARIGDRRSRRAVMVGCDLLRAGLFAAMAVSGLPLGVLLVLLTIAVFVGPAFSAAEVSYLAAALDSEHFRVGTGLRMGTNQIAQVAGFALGGVVVTALDPHGALVVDAATYLASATGICVGLRRVTTTGAARPGKQKTRPQPGPVRLWRDHRVRSLLTLSTVAGLFVVPEGLAVPLAAQLHASTVQTGLLLASIPLGGAVGVILLSRYVPKQRRFSLAGWMAVVCGVPLAATGFVHSWAVAVACWLVSGALAAFQVEIFTATVQIVPDRARSRLVGVGSALLMGAQGLSVVGFGLVAMALPTSWAIAVAGITASSLSLALVVGPLAWTWRPDQAGRLNVHHVRGRLA